MKGATEQSLKLGKVKIKKMGLHLSRKETDLRDLNTEKTIGIPSVPLW